MAPKKPTSKISYKKELKDSFKLLFSAPIIIALYLVMVVLITLIQTVFFKDITVMAGMTVEPSMEIIMAALGKLAIGLVLLVILSYIVMVFVLKMIRGLVVKSKPSSEELMDGMGLFAARVLGLGVLLSIAAMIIMAPIAFLMGMTRAIAQLLGNAILSGIMLGIMYIIFFGVYLLIMGLIWNILSAFIVDNKGVIESIKNGWIVSINKKKDFTIKLSVLVGVMAVTALPSFIYGAILGFQESQGMSNYVIENYTMYTILNNTLSIPMMIGTLGVMIFYCLVYKKIRDQ